MSWDRIVDVQLHSSLTTMLVIVFSVFDILVRFVQRFSWTGKRNRSLFQKHFEWVEEIDSVSHTLQTEDTKEQLRWTRNEQLNIDCDSFADCWCQKHKRWISVGSAQTHMVYGISNFLVLKDRKIQVALARTDTEGMQNFRRRLTDDVGNQSIVKYNKHFTTRYVILRIHNY